MTGGRIAVDVRLFAVLRERAGTDRLRLDLPAGATVAAALDATWDRIGDEDLRGAASGIAVAVDRSYAARDAVLSGGEEVALIPPVSGGAGPPVAAGGGHGAPAGVTHVAVGPEPIDQAALHARVAGPGTGAVVTFSGLPRDVPELRYEAHEEMAAERIAAILADVLATPGVVAVAAAHRTGPVPALEPAIVVAVGGRHRGEAFAAAREALDRIKGDAPIWKAEVTGEGVRPVAGAPAPGSPDGPPLADGGAGAAAPAPVAAPAPGVAAGPSADAASRVAATSADAGGVLPHLAPDGAATMVDVGPKRETERRAVAAALVAMEPATARLVRDGDAPKGDVVSVARLAGIAAAKRTPDLVPLAHPLPLTKVGVDVVVHAERGEVHITAEARTRGRTGVELEAMVAAQVAALNVYDMVKGVERGVRVGPVVLVEKTGGRHDFSGPAPWDAHPAAPAPATPAPAAASAPAEPVPARPAAPAPTATASHHAPDHRPLDRPGRAGLVVVSSTRTGGDPGAAALERLAADLGLDVVASGHVPDDRDAIAARLRALADDDGCDVILTAGGTGLTVDDVTPEAARDVADRDAPGIAEALRLAAREHTANWSLSRGVAVVRGRTLVVTLPGSPKAAAEAVPVLLPVLGHAIALLRR